MASLLVFIDGTRIRELVPAELRNSGQTRFLPRGPLPTQVDRLDPDATLFVFTLENSRAIMVASIDDPELDDGVYTGGEALLRDHDVTEVLPRLGCRGEIAAWAAVPRVLPPGDVDVLRYALGLDAGLARRPEPPEPIVGDDAALVALRDAIYADPRSDEVRAIYADYLQMRGDPRGELIALQLARVRAAGAVTERETALLARLRELCAEPLTAHVSRFELERGFVRSCATSDRTMLTPPIAAHPAWATVEELSTRDYPLLANPHLRARRIAIVGPELVKLVAEPRRLPFEVIVGIESQQHVRLRHLSNTGVHIEDEANWRRVMSRGALESLRVLAVNYRALGAQRVEQLIRSSLGADLEQLDLWCELDDRTIGALRSVFDRTDLTLLTVRFELSARSVREPTSVAVIGLRRSSREPILRLQLADRLDLQRVTFVLRMLSPLTQGIPRIEVNDLVEPRLAETRNPLLFERLHTMFTRVAARPGEPLAP